MKTKQRILTVSAALILATSLGAQRIPDPSPSCPGFASMTPCSWQSPYCGDDCGNTPFCPTTCWTTDTGPAWSGAGGPATTQLYCPRGTYANCHYSGPPQKTGTNPDNIPLPCKVRADGKMADCKCQVFDGPSYVKMYGIMNLGVLYETIAACGSDGSLCKNMETCPPRSALQGEDRQQDGQQRRECERATLPPVCKYIVQQRPDDPENSLIPGADLISTYGFGMDGNYPDVSPTSTTCNDTVVAGCMTAPCIYDKSDERYAYCACPTIYKSSFTLSQDGQICNLPEGYVWE